MLRMGSKFMSQPSQPPTHAFFNVGIVAAGRGLARIVKRLTDPDFSRAFPHVRLAGVTHAPGRPAPAALPAGVPYFDSHEALYDERLQVSILFDLTGDPDFFARLRATAPSRISLVNRNSALFIWRLMVAEQERAQCQAQLTHASSLLAALFDQVEEDVLLFDPEGRLLDMNKSAHQRKHISKEALLGRACKELEATVFCKQNEEDGCPFRETLQTKKKAENVHTMVKEDGRMQYVRVYTYPIFDQRKKLTHILEIRRDITKRTNLELRVQQSEKMAAIGELATYMAHEIRNPLFAIGGFANSLLRMESLDEKAREKAEVIRSEAQRLDNILKTTLNFARPNVSSEGRVDVNKVAEETMRLMSMGCGDRRIDPALELAPSLVKAKGDPEMLKQCLVNMIKNSIEAMPQGGSLTLRTGVRGSRVFVEVEDTGHGIPRALRDKIFNPFFSTKEKGSGLGLAMIKKIVEEMGGEVELQSQEGHGARVTLLLLPVLAVESPDGLPE
jgi:PAS domain S-box-containing protein